MAQQYERTPEIGIRSQLKSNIKSLFHWLGKYSPTLYYLLQYHRAIRKLGDQAKERNRLFHTLITESAKKKCLQIGVKEIRGAKFGLNWVSVDRYDTRNFIDFHYDIHDLKFENDSFDVAVCNSILEHIAHPEVAIKELFRVLKPGGLIWVQLPFNFPYHEAPKDYWRVSPDGLKIWMKNFEEIRCGSFLFNRSSLVTSTFFYGRKPDAAFLFRSGTTS